MNPIHYQYSLTNFVVFDEYQIDYFDKSSANQSQLDKIRLDNLRLNRLTDKKDLDGLTRRITVPTNIIKKFIMESKGAKVYNPLFETPELYLELNKINFFDEDSLIKFSKEYGLPYDEHEDLQDRGVYGSNLFKENATLTALRTMSILGFYEYLMNYKRVVKIWSDIKQGNTSELKEIKEIFSFYSNFNNDQREDFIKEVSLEGYIRMVNADLGIVDKESAEIINNLFINNPQQIVKLQEKASAQTATWNKVQNLSDKEIALAYLNLELNKLDSGQITTTYSHGRIMPAVKFNNLMEVAAYQLKQAIFDDVKLEPCLNCGALFQPNRPHQKFCSPLPGRKRSTCENTYNQRLKRERRKKAENRG